MGSQVLGEVAKPIEGKEANSDSFGRQPSRIKGRIHLKDIKEAQKSPFENLLPSGPYDGTNKIVHYSSLQDISNQSERPSPSRRFLQNSQSITQDVGNYG